MPLDLPKALGLLPKIIGTVESAIDTIGKIKALPVKNAKTVATTLGVTTGSTLYELCDLADDVIAAAG